MRQVHSIRVHRWQRPRDGVVNSSVARLYRTILALLRVVIDEFRARVKRRALMFAGATKESRVVSCYLQTGPASFTIMAKILSEVGIEP